MSVDAELLQSPVSHHAVSVVPCASDFVYLSGGRPNYLQATLRDSPAWQAITNAVERSGLLTGCSAGAMVQGERFAGLPRAPRGFGLWPGVHIVPHFDQIPSPIVALMRRLVGKNYALVGTDANAALANLDGTYRVIGDQVTV